MLITAPVTSAALAATLLVHYSFDLNGYSTSELIDKWKKNYPTNWLHLGVIEALYQGRYKAVSVQQILNLWQRRDQVIYHFNTEFERLICSQFPESLNVLSTPVLSSAQKHTTIEQLTNSHLSPSKVEPKSISGSPAPRQLTSGKLEEYRQFKDEGRVLASPSFKIVAETPQRELATVGSRFSYPEKPVPMQLPQSLPPSPIINRLDNLPPKLAIARNLLPRN